MELAGDDRIVEPQAHPGPGDPRQAEVVALRLRRESLAQRLERERLTRELADRERRARIEREREAREQARRQRWEQRRREREQRMQREREAEAKRRRRRRVPEPQRVESAPNPPQIQPRVQGRVSKRARAAENRRRSAARRRGLFWPTAKAGLAVTVMLGLSAAVGSVIGLPVPGLDAGSGRQSLGNAALVGLGAGTAPGLDSGYVFPVLGPHDFGEPDARFGASRYGHVHEGQDIFAKTGTPEVAVHGGVVVDRGKDGGRPSGGRGNYVVIYSPEDDHSFVYMHMLDPSPVQLGDRVHAGEVIGKLGCSGSCEGPHLHFEVRIGKASTGAETKAVDPLPYLRQWPEPTPG
jgi:murein DD-endopeptidase MepM/ murein hydrolase activator NlpD